MGKYYRGGPGFQRRGENKSHIDRDALNASSGDRVHGHDAVGPVKEQDIEFLAQGDLVAPIGFQNSIGGFGRGDERAVSGPDPAYINKLDLRYGCGDFIAHEPPPFIPAFRVNKSACRATAFLRGDTMACRLGQGEYGPHYPAGQLRKINCLDRQKCSILQNFDHSPRLTLNPERLTQIRKLTELRVQS